jgi:maltose O-acetyltransferase
MIKRLRMAIWRLRGYETIGYARKRGAVLGDRLSLGPGCLFDFHFAHLLTIGNDVTIAPRVKIYTHDASTYRTLKHDRIARVTIGDRVFIGSGSLLLPGVTIGEDSVIAAGSVVTKDVPAGVVFGGNPARAITSTAELLDRRRSDLETSPNWDGAWRRAGQPISASMRAEQRAALADGPGFSG